MNKASHNGQIDSEIFYIVENKLPLISQLQYLAGLTLEFI